jgi:hypothetical protein
MKNKLYILIINLLLLTCCKFDEKSPNSKLELEKGKIKNMNQYFEEYLKSLDQIPLPLIHNSESLTLPQISLNYNKNAFFTYKYNNTSYPLGILFRDLNVITLIDVSIGDWGPVPFLITFDRGGNKIDSLGPYKKSGEDIESKTIEYLNINKDRTIVVIDSNIKFILDTVPSGIIRKETKSNSGLTKYKINQKGYFVVFKEGGSK